jgi:hypothetical protein
MGIDPDIARMAAAMLEVLRPSCHDDQCMCSDPRERFECVLGDPPESLAKEMLAAFKKG